MERRNITVHGLIVTFAGNDIPDPASRTWCVSVATGNNMDMGTEYGLPRCFTAVHANSESLRLEFLLQNVLNAPHKIKSIRVFVITHLQSDTTCRFGITRKWLLETGKPSRKEKDSLISAKKRAIYSAEDAIHSYTRSHPLIFGLRQRPPPRSLFQPMPRSCRYFFSTAAHSLRVPSCSIVTVNPAGKRPERRWAAILLVLFAVRPM